MTSLLTRKAPGLGDILDFERPEFGYEFRDAVGSKLAADRDVVMPLMETLCSKAVTAFARVVTGVRPEWRGAQPSATQRIYFANHSSHGDFVLIWSVLPVELRARTRPVAGADYWLKSAARRFVGSQVFRAVLIERDAEKRTEDPIETMARALDEGDSLILFPEGTRNMTPEQLMPFKSGLYNLALRRPDIELVPAWIDNISRVLPKGELLPLPLLCSVAFGAPLHLAEGEERKAFLARARGALLALAPSPRHRTASPPATIDPTHAS